MVSHYLTTEQSRLSLHECLELGRKSAEGDLDARETLILAHIPLVKSMASTYMNKGVEMDDLLQEGYYGLIIAVDRYDYKRGVQFSTYAAHWIRKRMSDAIREQNIEIPIIFKKGGFRLLIKICCSRANLIKTYGYEPTCREIAEDIDLPEKKVENLLKTAKRFIDITSPTFFDTFEEGAHASAEEEYLESILVLDEFKLTDREKIILSRAFCSSEGEGETLKEIAASMNLSYESIRLAYRSGLNKIKQAISDKQVNI